MLTDTSAIPRAPATPIVTRLPTLAAPEELRKVWNELAGDNPFRRWEWAESWWNAYGGETTLLGRRRELLTLAVSDGAQVIGFAPWHLEFSATRGVIIRPLGAGKVCSEYLGVLARPGCEDQVAAALADAISERRVVDRASGAPAVCWDLLELKNARHDDLATHSLLQELAARGAIVHRRAGAPCWQIDLPADWQTYLARLSRSHRKQALRIERRYFETGRACLRTAEDDASLDAGLAILFRLHRRRWESRGVNGCFASRRFAAFLASVARREARSGVLELHWLELDGQPIAAEFHLRAGGAVHAYQSGVEPEALDHEPGRMITLALLKRAIAAGRQRFDFLRGDEPYKAHFRAAPCPTSDLRVASATSTARLRHGLWLAGSNMKGWLKSSLRMATGPAGMPN